MKKLGLVLEGGAMRGVYTAGVLDYFTANHFYTDYVIGVSAGACQACSYLSRQKGRNKRVNLEYINDPRYLSFRNLIKTGGVFGFEFMFHDIAEKLIPFDFDTFEKSKEEFVIGVTNCVTGEAEYYYKSNTPAKKMFDVCAASSCMPLISKEVVIDGKAFMDGGTSDSIPINRAIEDGCEKNIVVLTRNSGYRKKPYKPAEALAGVRYRNFKGLQRAMRDRHIHYNETLEQIEKLEKQEKVFIIRPSKTVTVGRMERDKKKLFELYKQGYLDAKGCFQDMKEWIKK